MLVRARRYSFAPHGDGGGVDSGMSFMRVVRLLVVVVKCATCFFSRSSPTASFPWYECLSVLESGSWRATSFCFLFLLTFLNFEENFFFVA